MKRKTLTLTICFLALVSIVSVGFASWVISRPVESNETTGSISAEAVQSDDLSIALAWEGTNNIHYGKPNPVGTYDYDWLSNDGNPESLTVTLNITLSGTDIADGVLNKISALKLSLYIPKVIDDSETNLKLNDNRHAFSTALLSQYVALPTVKINDGETTVYDIDNGVNIDKALFTQANGYKISVTLHFGWGDAFKVGGQNLNPLAYFNSFPYDEKASDAENALGAIYALNELSYKVLISPVE